MCGGGGEEGGLPAGLSSLFPQITQYSPTTYRIILDSNLFILVVNTVAGSEVIIRSETRM